MRFENFVGWLIGVGGSRPPQGRCREAKQAGGGSMKVLCASWRRGGTRTAVDYEGINVERAAGEKQLPQET